VASGMGRARPGELTLRGDIESSLSFKRKTTQRKVLGAPSARSFPPFAGGERNVICLGWRKTVGRAGGGVAWCERRFKRVEGWIFNVFLELLLFWARFVNCVAGGASSSCPAEAF
jgi:hypothetical protein